MEFRLWVIVQQINRVPFIRVNENEMLFHWYSPRLFEYEAALKIIKTLFCKLSP